MVMTSSVLVLKHLDDVTTIRKSGLQLLLGLTRFQERGRTDASPLCAGCSPTNVSQQNRNNVIRHNVSLILLLYFSLIFGKSVDNEDVSLDSFSLHHIRQLLYYPSAGLLLSWSPARERRNPDCLHTAVPSLW